jgi:anion-transporting  ArsA/GET3 family ATPase
VRLHVVTGKGGTGKTAVASALALGLATNGRRVLLVEVEERQGISRLFDVPPLGYQEKTVAVGPWGGQVLAQAVDSRSALLEYLDTFYRLGPAGKLLDRSGAIDFAATIAPGLRDVLLTGKVYEAVRRQEKPSRAPVFDTVVLDAPPTGRVTHFLNVNSEVSGLAKVGPIHNQASSIMGLFRSALTVVHLVTLLEEMPVQETLDAIDDLTAIGLPIGGIVVNQERRQLLSKTELTAAARGRLDATQVRDGLWAAGLADDAAEGGELATALISDAGEHARRVHVQARELQRLRETGRPLYRLGYLAGGVDLGGLYTLAEQLREQGLA